MAMIFKCDRCGSNYEQESIDYEMGVANQTGVPLYWIRKFLPAINTDINMDLCPKCLASLRSWFNREHDCSDCRFTFYEKTEEENNE